MLRVTPSAGLRERSCLIRRTPQCPYGQGQTWWNQGCVTKLRSLRSLQNLARDLGAKAHPDKIAFTTWHLRNSVNKLFECVREASGAGDASFWPRGAQRFYRVTPQQNPCDIFASWICVLTLDSCFTVDTDTALGTTWEVRQYQCGLAFI